MTVTRRLLLFVGAVLLAGGCGESSSPTAPSVPSAPVEPVLIEQRGPVAIGFLDATPPLGSTITGCGNRVAGCAGRVRMRFALRGPETGPVLRVAAFLHATNLRACLLAEAEGFTLQAAEARVVELVFDRSDDCAVPLDIATMAVVVEGTVEVASRRAWELKYALAP